MTAHPFVSWLFIASLKAQRRPWLAYEIARTLYDDERTRYFGLALGSA